MRLLKLSILAAALAGSAAVAQVEEIFSKYVQVFNPQGSFAQRLIRLTPPGKKDWRVVDDQRHDYRLQVPDDAQVETRQEGNRALLVYLSDAEKRPRPTLRVDIYPAGKDDRTEVDAEYAKEYAEQYPTAAFNNKFSTTDTGLVQLPKNVRLALVAGSYPQGAVRGFRVQLAHLSTERQLFVTFDCAEADWPQYQDEVGRILLTLDLAKGKRK